MRLERAAVGDDSIRFHSTRRLDCGGKPLEHARQIVAVRETVSDEQNSGGFHVLTRWRKAVLKVETQDVIGRQPRHPICLRRQGT